MDEKPPIPQQEMGERSGYPPPYSSEQVPMLQHKAPGPDDAPTIHIQQPMSMGGQAQTVVTVVGVMFSAEPTAMQCQNCHQQIVTQVNYESGCCTYLAVGLCLLCGCWMGCCLIPCCMNDCQDAIHTCPQCKSYIGTYKRL